MVRVEDCGIRGKEFVDPWDGTLEAVIRAGVGRCLCRAGKKQDEEGDVDSHLDLLSFLEQWRPRREEGQKGGEKEKNQRKKKTRYGI
jgi:hypothetical protein